MEQLLGGTADVQHGPHRQRPEELTPVLPGDDCGGVRFFIIAAQLGKDLVETDPHGERQPQLPLDPLPQLIRHGPGISAQKVEGMGDVQPTLVDAEGLHQVGIGVVDGVDPPGVLVVEIVVGRQQHQIRALFLGLPDGLRRLDAELFGRFVFGQDDAVSGGGVPADGHGDRPQLRVAQQLHRGVKTVEITVQNHTVHGAPPFVLYRSTSVRC